MATSWAVQSADSLQLAVLYLAYRTMRCCSGGCTARRTEALFPQRTLSDAACCVAAGPLPVVAYAKDKGDKLSCFNAAATVHTVLLVVPAAANPFKIAYTDIQPKVYLRSKSQTLLIVRFSPPHTGAAPSRAARELQRRPVIATVVAPLHWMCIAYLCALVPC
jgi:hypothetical protein